MDFYIFFKIWKAFRYVPLKMKGLLLISIKKDFDFFQKVKEFRLIAIKIERLLLYPFNTKTFILKTKDSSEDERNLMEKGIHVKMAVFAIKITDFYRFLLKLKMISLGSIKNESASNDFY